MRQGDQFTISARQIEYLDTWMNKVSRTFAVVVPAVEPPLQYYLAIAYLICRVVDNIEDCSQPHAWKIQRFSELELLLDEPQQASEILHTWENEAWPGLSDDEEKIMGFADGSPLWEIYSTIPSESRAIIQRWAKTMASGMSQLDDPQVQPHFITISDKQVLQDKQDYDDYCYIVAGTVGHMATELVSHHYGLSQPITDQLIRNAEACGRGLQKTNIIKDFAKDLQRGISYLPAEWMQEADNKPLSLGGAPQHWIQIILDDVLADLDKATEYLLTLPADAVGYRKASLLCLLPAYQTLILASEEKSKLFTPQHELKSSHEKMAQCLQDTERLVLNNDGILDYSRSAKLEIDQNLNLDSAIEIEEKSPLRSSFAGRGA